MKTLSLQFGLGLLASVSLLTACAPSSQHPATENPYTGAYVPPVQHRAAVGGGHEGVPRLDYIGFDANWYGGTPDYFNTSVIMND